MLITLLLALTFATPTHAEVISPPDTGYLYKVTLVRATPGKLLDLIDLYKARTATLDAEGDALPFWMRHSQGDQWDLMLIQPMESYAAYYVPARIARRKPDAEFEDALQEHVAWTEDLFAYGPPLADVRDGFDEAGFFHVEMFKALHGHHDLLYKEREMENSYLAEVNRPQNLIFWRDQGAAWDVFTIGFYRDIKHFAESADIPLDEEDRAAKAAGFESVYTISPYLRSLIQYHHDTLAVAIR